MCLVAFLAVGDDHLRRVRLVALGALRDLAVDVVTGRTVKGGMLALVLPQLSDLLRVACDTGICYIAGKGNVQRRMRVFVATETALKVEVRLSHMAVAALRDGFLNCGRMADMTARTADVFVLSSGRCNVSRRSIMTFQTVFVCQNGLLLGRRHTGISENHRHQYSQ
jgi:hypothetical protein